jgi:hypothetical protein
MMPMIITMMAVTMMLALIKPLALGRIEMVRGRLLVKPNGTWLVTPSFPSLALRTGYPLSACVCSWSGTEPAMVWATAAGKRGALAGRSCSSTGAAEYAWALSVRDGKSRRRA